MSEQRKQFWDDGSSDVVIDRAKFAYDIFAAHVAILKSDHNSRLDFHVHLRVSLKNIEEEVWKAGYYCLAFNDSTIDINRYGCDIRRNVLGGQTSCRDDPQDFALPINDMDKAVFVRITQFAENPKRVCSISGPQFIRLQPLYDCLRFRADLLDVSCKRLIPEDGSTKSGLP